MKKGLGVLAAAGAALLLSVPALAEENTGKEEKDRLSYKEKKDLLTETALEYEIPPEILKAIAYEETGMKQFDEAGNVIRNENDDGGIGMMQVTLDEDDLMNRNVDKERLEHDTAYNIEVGAQLLEEKWNWSGNLLPAVNDGQRHILENWYFAVLAYNGLDERNDPNKSGDTYQEGIYERVAKSNLFDVSVFDLPGVDTVYENDSNIMSFEEKHVTTETKTPSLQMFKEGDDVYSYRESGNSINFREGPSTGTALLGNVAVYTPLTVEGALEHDNNPANHYGFYPFYYSDSHGYMASSYVQEGAITAFPDVRGDELIKAVAELEAQGIINGHEDGTFKPNDPIKRKHVAAMLDKALDLQVPGDYELQAAGVDKDNPYYEPLRAVEYHGIMTGSNGDIRKEENMTRAQMASVLTTALADYAEPAGEQHHFADIGFDYWNYDAINTLYHNGWTTEDPYRPSGDVTRGQFALFLTRAME
ncbi:S-layer homology domain-containing protein [Alteribacillus persepolensis]|uniref:S-layer homology domain-containing protein n=1 Tax=Alteribacillus persepolensis TaxID=568899 RepID=A0A1G8AE74_9BACI|nr:S-layer homology domain-containing protein [Alteribacillus persepolensis]SDH18630.1 S-layer homology domain-containing protein [Alteribacillus persepolensis]